MNKIILSILVFAIVFTVPVSAQNEVYLVPMQSNATYCKTAEVELWINATEFQGGQINLTYDPTCAKVTNWKRNTTNFMIGGWSHYDGREWITFSTMDPQPVLLTGKYMLGTLTIHCINECKEGCKTPLAFVEPSMILDDRGKQVPVSWTDGRFWCRGTIIDTGPGDYPSIFGTHKGTITPNQTITVSKLYTYPCNGTGGHTEFVWIYGNGINESAYWKGYVGDWHNITFDKQFTLHSGVIYNYTIKTGSYPQIIHNASLTNANGTITCTEFVDANGNRYKDWIPAIRLE